MAKRFSKKQILSYLGAKIDFLESEYGFSDHTGWKQVEDRPIEVIVEYGKWVALQKMESDILTGYVDGMEK